MDFCLCYKIKNKSNINTGFLGGRRRPQPRAAVACGATRAPRWSPLPGRLGADGPGRPFSRRAAPGRLRSGLCPPGSSGTCRSAGEGGSNFQIIFREGGNRGGLPSPAADFSAGAGGAPPPASLPSFPFLFFSCEAGVGAGAAPRVGSGPAGYGAWLSAAAASAPRASHHLAEPLLKGHPSVCADTAFLPEKNHC